MITAVLGAPGSGKSAVRDRVASAATSHVVFDWDALLEPASTLFGADIRHAPDAWHAYRALVRGAVDAVRPLPVVLFTVCTPAELHDWSIGRWVLLDSDDDVLRARLAHRSDDAAGALADAATYRTLGLDRIDTTGLSLAEVASAIVERL